MIRSLSIENYRLLRDLRIQGLTHVNLFVGKNSTGKSSFLEAVSLLANRIQSDQLTQDNLEDLLASWQRILSLRGETGYVNEDGRQTVVYQLRRTFPEHHLFDDQGRAKAILVQMLKGDLFVDSQPLALRVKLFQGDMRENGHSIVSNRVLFIDTAQDLDTEFIDPYRLNVSLEGDYIAHSLPGNLLARLASQNVHLLTTYQSMNRQYVAHMWDRIQLTPREDDVIRMLQILEPRIERIAFKTADSGILVKLTGQEPVPLGSLGNGLNRMFDMALCLVGAAGGYLCVDEIETGLHYRAMTDMWRLIFEAARRLNVQVFATTHSWDCIESFAEALALQEDAEAGALFRLQRANEQIKAIRYSADELQVATREEIEVR